jgi:hypothetical protein
VGLIGVSNIEEVGLKHRGMGMRTRMSSLGMGMCMGIIEEVEGK